MKRKKLFLAMFCACMLLSGCNAEKTSTSEETIDITEQDSGMKLIVEEVNGPYDKTIAIYRNVYTVFQRIKKKEKQGNRILHGMLLQNHDFTALCQLH